MQAPVKVKYIISLFVYLGKLTGNKYFNIYIVGGTTSVCQMSDQDQTHLYVTFCHVVVVLCDIKRIKA